MIEDSPDVTVLQYLISLRPAIPMSKERPCTETSNGELKRWCLNSAVVINGKKVKPTDIMEFPVTSLVLFPNAPKSRCTLA